MTPKQETPAAPLTPETMKRGGLYNWKYQPDRLIYLKKFNGWHQFKKIGDPRPVWCEVLDEDLHWRQEDGSYRASRSTTILNCAGYPLVGWADKINPASRGASKHNSAAQVPAAW